MSIRTHRLPEVSAPRRRTCRSHCDFPVWSFLAALLGVLGVAGAVPGATPVGGEFQVNTYTTSAQLIPAVAADASGNFVVVWQSDGSAGSDNSFHSIQGQRYDASGNTVGSEFQVNSYTTSEQFVPSSGRESSGNNASAAGTI